MFCVAEPRRSAGQPTLSGLVLWRRVRRVDSYPIRRPLLDWSRQNTRPEAASCAEGVTPECAQLGSARYVGRIGFVAQPTLDQSSRDCSTRHMRPPNGSCVV